jgi:hypothetical protein
MSFKQPRMTQVSYLHCTPSITSLSTQQAPTEAETEGKPYIFLHFVSLASHKYTLSIPLKKIVTMEKKIILHKFFQCHSHQAVTFSHANGRLFLRTLAKKLASLSEAFRGFSVILRKCHANTFMSPPVSEPLTNRGVLLSTLLQYILNPSHHLLNVLLQIANKLGLS